MTAMRNDGEPLKLVVRDTRAKHYLFGRPVGGGDPIDLCFSGGWVTGRYEWSGEPAERPSFHYSLELIDEGRVAQGVITIPDGAILRWPNPELNHPQ
ncbi:MAG: hypothetical protein ABW321_22390 [Polyangiales bacterium]